MTAKSLMRSGSWWIQWPAIQRSRTLKNALDNSSVGWTGHRIATTVNGEGLLNTWMELYSRHNFFWCLFISTRIFLLYVSQLNMLSLSSKRKNVKASALDIVFARSRNMCTQIQVQTPPARGKAENSKNGACIMTILMNPAALVGPYAQLAAIHSLSKEVCSQYKEIFLEPCVLQILPWITKTT